MGDALGRAAGVRLEPNPFRDRARVSLVTRSAGPVEMGVYDPLGREVRSLAPRAWLEAGTHTMEWDGRTEAGAEAAPGLYLLRATADGRRYLRPLVKLRVSNRPLFFCEACQV